MTQTNTFSTRPFNDDEFDRSSIILFLDYFLFIFTLGWMWLQKGKWDDRRLSETIELTKTELFDRNLSFLTFKPRMILSYLVETAFSLFIEFFLLFKTSSKLDF